MSQKKIVLSDNALEIAKSRYFHNGEDWEECCNRVSKGVGDIEKDKQEYIKKFNEIIYNMDFIPAGRILRNSGRPKGSMLNCYVCPIGDSIEEIGQFFKDSLTLWSEGGGVGCNFSPLRPNGAEILGKGGKSSGLISFIEAADAISKTIESGGQRRAAALACVDVSHPEIIDFINCKLKDGRMSHFNISVLVNEEFLKAVEKDSEWILKFNNIEYNRVKAREIWDLIIHNMLQSAEPGLLNTSKLYKNNSYYFDPVVSTNPCITGETLIAVADGRDEITIKELAENGDDVLVYSFNEKTKKIEIKTMRNPRITGFNKKILKITLTSGLSFRCTENHRLYLTHIDDLLETKKVEAKDLKIGDLLFHSLDFQSKYRYIIKIEEDGFENVYNGTVDDNHNYYIKIRDKKNKLLQILSCNCGEAILENYGSCCLGSLVLPNFITGTTNTNWQKLEKTIKLAIRFLDNVIDVNKFTLKEIDTKAHNSRRIGLGIMGLADYLFSKELRYGSKEALLEIEKLMRFIRDTAYESSVELAVEKGAFPKFEPISFGNSSFVRKLPASLRMKIKSKGIRNVSVLSIAPSGTISLLSETTSGIEPLIYKSYKRKDRVSERIYIHPKYKQLLLTGNSVPDWFVDMGDLKPEDHLETQAIIQRYVDGAVSKTINMPSRTTSEQLSSIILEYIRELKGVTIYVDGSREGQVYTSLTEAEALEYILNESVSNTLNIDDVECKCQVKKDEDDNEVEVCTIPSKKEEEN